MMRDLLDDDGENRAVRCFLMLYGGKDSVTLGEMRDHLASSGFDDHWPDWTCQDLGTHLTKGGAQAWLRYLFALEGAAPLPPAVDEQAIPIPDFLRNQENLATERAAQPQDEQTKFKSWADGCEYVDGGRRKDMWKGWQARAELGKDQS